MNKDIFMSVIIPVYNVRPYLRDCLNSLLYQTRKIDEIIIVNDGSTDGSEKICEEYYKKNDNIILIEQDNQGLSAARNVGLKKAAGEYVVFVDSDDYVDTNMNQCLVSLLTGEGIDILYYSADIVDETGKGCDLDIYVRSDQFNRDVMTGMDFFRRIYPDNFIVSSCLAAYKKTFLDYNNIAFPKGLYFEDNVFFIQTVLKARKVQSISERLYIRRYRSGSIMKSKKNLKKCLDYIEIYHLINQLLYLYKYKIDYKDLYKCYLSRQTMFILQYIKEYRTNNSIQEKVRDLINIFFQYWGELFINSSLNWNEIYFLITAIFYLQPDTKVYSKLMSKINKEIGRKLGRLPLNQVSRRIGIYGIGRHTENLIALYERYVGKICCELYFIETQKNKEVYMGRPVVDCDNILENTDGIVISSLLYEKEMQKELQIREKKCNKIISLYSDGDIKDLVQIADLIAQQEQK